jgi:hypothetical protein
MVLVTQFPQTIRGRGWPFFLASILHAPADGGSEEILRQGAYIVTNPDRAALALA